MSNVSTKPILEAIANHLDCDIDSPRVIAFMAISVEERIEYQSQQPKPSFKPLEKKICPDCKGSATYLDSNGVYQSCDTCEGYGIIANNN